MSHVAPVITRSRTLHQRSAFLLALCHQAASDPNRCCNTKERTGRMSAVIQEVQPNFKVKGQRFSSEELKRLFNELVENSLAVWLDATTIEISPN